MAPIMDCEKTNFAAYDRDYNELMNIASNFIAGVQIWDIIIIFCLWIMSDALKWSK